MVDHSTGANRPALTTDEVRAFIERAPRCKVRVAVLCQPSPAGAAASPSDFVEAQLVNLSRSGMFLACQRLLAIGDTVEFQFSLDEQLVVLQGTAEVARIEEGGERGMGLRFTKVDEAGRALIERIIEVAAAEPPRGSVEYDHGTVRIVLTAATAPYFTYNPLLHIGVGGCFIPSDDDVPLGTGYQLDIVDAAGQLLLRCKAKVAAKQERRIGVRLVDVDRAELLRLRREIAKLSPNL
jgi:uncharacterized protein (TIGR02266 family)